MRLFKYPHFNHWQTTGCYVSPEHKFIVALNGALFEDEVPNMTMPKLFSRAHGWWCAWYNSPKHVVDTCWYSWESYPNGDTRRGRDTLRKRDWDANMRRRQRFWDKLMATPPFNTNNQRKQR